MTESREHQQALNFIIEEEQTEDEQDIREVNLAAFERSEEADIVDQLRQTSPVFISLVARINQLVVGHILFTPAYIIKQGQ